MNTGIQDAHNLGWKLSAVVKGASPALLDSYGAERLPVAASVIALSNERMKEAMEQKGIPVRRDAMSMQLGIHYRDSVLARDDREQGAGLRGGDRAPDVTGLRTADGERRLFELTRGGRFTLLNFGAPVELESSPFEHRVLRVVTKPAEPGEVADPEGLLARTYGATGHTLVLIRPDGYVGMISDAGEVSAVSEYLAAIAR